MDLQRSIFDDESGVSPVIGVILMVAVTVIIAAVIGSTALGLGDEVSETPPQAQFEAEQDDEYTLYDQQDNEEIPFSTAVEIEHNSGEDINTENIRVTVDGDPAHVATDETEQELGGPSSSDHPAAANPWYDKDTISSGDEARILIAGTYIDDYDAVVDPVNEDRVLYRGDEPDLYVNSSADSPSISNIDLEEGQTLRIIWESGEQSQTLYEYEIR